MPGYLSPERFDELGALAQDQTARPGVTVKIQYRTTGGPEGDFDYYWILEEGKFLEAKLGTLPDADFTLTMSYDDAAKVHEGDLHPNAAFMQGKLKVAGNKPAAQARFWIMAKKLALLPFTNSPDWKPKEEKARPITEY
jgi:putative sterol carrier protein